MAPDCMRAATRMIMAAWRRKERMSVLRRRGLRRRLRREKKKEPRTKQEIEMSDLAQPYGLLVAWPVEPPRPMMMVLPVCMETKVP